MAVLTNCAVCGHQLASDARRCPKCGTQKPFRCSACGSTMERPYIVANDGRILCVCHERCRRCRTPIKRGSQLGRVVEHAYIARLWSKEDGT